MNKNVKRENAIALQSTENDNPILMSHVRKALIEPTTTEKVIH